MFPNYPKPPNLRQTPHHRIDDEEEIFRKYDLGRKLGQVN